MGTPGKDFPPKGMTTICPPPRTLIVPSVHHLGELAIVGRMPNEHKIVYPVSRWNLLLLGFKCFFGALFLWQAERP